MSSTWDSELLMAATVPPSNVAIDKVFSGLGILQLGIGVRIHKTPLVVSIYIQALLL